MARCEELNPELRQAWWPQLTEKILETQEEDGSMWDYAFFSYHRIYGTAWSASILAKALADKGAIETKVLEMVPSQSGEESASEVTPKKLR